MKTRAAVAIAPETDLELCEIEVDDPRPDEVRVRVVASGVCHTDAIVRDQWYPVPQPLVLGHEGAGIVEMVGSAVSGISPGDKVVLGPDYCGRCNQCRAGHPMYCDEFSVRNFGGQRLDGTTSFSGRDGRIGSHFMGQSSFAEHTNVAANSVIKVPDDAPLDILGPLGCGIMTGAGTVLNVLDPEPGSSIAIFGSGAVGMAGMLAAKAVGVTRIIMVDVVDERLRAAKELGATHTVNSRESDVVDEIRRMSDGGVNYALDTTGSSSVFPHLASALATRGHGALVGATRVGDMALFDARSLLQGGITISLAIEGDAVPSDFVPRLIDLRKQGLLPFDELITKYPIDQINKAFSDSAAGGALKPVVEFV
jgi:aryl-alcohol dehydrogenase